MVGEFLNQAMQATQFNSLHTGLKSFRSKKYVFLTFPIMWYSNIISQTLGRVDLLVKQWSDDKNA